MYWYDEEYWDKSLLNEKEVEATVLDCGAYIGDSVEPVCEIIPQKKIKYYAFEPFKDNYEKLQENIKQIGFCEEIKAYNVGVGIKSEKKAFIGAQNGDLEGGHFIFGEQNCDIKGECLEIVRIDDLEIDVNGVLYIKMDIEGSELDALMGAEETMKKYRPYLSICVHHRKNDLLYIPLYLRKVLRDYKFYLRGGYHTNIIAIPNSR